MPCQAEIWFDLLKSVQSNFPTIVQAPRPHDVINTHTHTHTRRHTQARTQTPKHLHNMIYMSFSPILFHCPPFFFLSLFSVFLFLASPCRSLSLHSLSTSLSLSLPSLVPLVFPSLHKKHRSLGPSPYQP